MSVQGTVVLYKPEKGFGFIKSASVNRDIFFHISEFRHEVLPTPGMKVAFDLKENADEKKSACNIRFLEAPRETHSKSEAQKRQPRTREEKQSNQTYTAKVRLREGSKNLGRQYGELKLKDRRLQFEGDYFFAKKIITRSLSFITSVETPFFGPYVIQGGGPKLFVEPDPEFIFFQTKDLKKLIRALEARL